jgi:hypothetical protein
MGWSILEPISADVCGVSVRRFAKEPIRVEENLAIVTDSLLIFCPQTIMDARGSEDVGGGIHHTHHTIHTHNTYTYRARCGVAMRNLCQFRFPTIGLVDATCIEVEVSE